MFPHSAQTFLDVFWRKQNRRLALVLHDGVLYFWEPDSPQFQSEPQEWVFAVDYQLGFSDESQITPQFLSSELEWALANNRVGRRFQLADTLTVFLHAYNGTTDYEEYLRQQSFVLFRLGEVAKQALFPPESEVFDVALSEWKRQLEVAAFNGEFGYKGFGDAVSEAVIPYTYPAFVRSTKICISRGTEAQMEHLATLIFQLAPEWIEEALSQPKCEGGVGIDVFLPLGKPAHYEYGAWTKFGFCSVPHPCAPLWDIWLNYFAPFPDATFHANDIEKGVRLFCLGFGPDNDCFDWEQNRPYELSLHEQMELKLELRSWLRDNVGLPEQRIAELLA